MRPDTLATSVDWSDAYHHVPVHVNLRSFLAFQVGATDTDRSVVRFGLGPLKAHIRATSNIQVFQYLNDCLFLSHFQAHTSQVTQSFVRLCIRLGLGVNLERSDLIATRTLVHLGIEWNFSNATARNLVARATEVRVLARRVMTAPSTPLPLLESLSWVN